MAKGSANGEDTKSECDSRNEPTWTNPFASHVGWNLEDDIRDVKDGQDLVVIVSGQVKIFLQSSKLCIT